MTISSLNNDKYLVLCCGGPVMSEFKIISATNESVELVSLKNELQPRPKFIEMFGSVGDYGKIIFEKITLIDLVIWISYYKMFSEIRFYAEVPTPILEAHTTLENRMVQSLGKKTESILEKDEFNITYAPYMENDVLFPKGGEYTTFDIHPSENLLEKLATDFHELERFLNKREQEPQKLHQFFKQRNFLNTEMISLVKRIIQYTQDPYCSRPLTEFLASELLTLFLLRTEGGWMPERYNTRNHDAIIYAREIIQHEAMNFDDEDLFSTEARLAQKVGLSIFQLRQGFRRAFGVSPHQMGLEIRLKKAEELLREEHVTVLDAALKTGFKSREGFSRAFKRVRGINPGAKL